MKHFFTSLVLLTFIFGKTKAQTWCPPGAVWNYTLFTLNPTISGYHELRYQDTVRVNGKLCQKLILRSYEIWASNGGSKKEDSGYVFTHVSNKVLTYLSSTNTFDTIADFNARPGSHWYNCGYQPAASTPSAYTKYTVRDTGHATINGVSLKFIEVGSGDSLAVFTPSNSWNLHRIYERIGDVGGFLIPPCSYYPVWTSNFASFTCYWDNTFPVYSLPGKKCNYNPVSIKEAGADSGTQFFPNPSNGLFTVHADYEGPFYIYSATGDLVKTIPWTSSSSILDLSDLPNGIYLVKASEAKQIPVQKLLKH